MKRYSIGIDPGKKTGFAVYDRISKKLIVVKTTDFWGLIFDLDELYKSENVHILVVEVPNNKHVWQKTASSRGAIERTAVNVGSVIREAELILEWAKLRKYNIMTQHPMGKIDKDTFKNITKWDGVTDPHKRDAGMLCYGL